MSAASQSVLRSLINGTEWESGEATTLALLVRNRPGQTGAEGYSAPVCMSTEMDRGLRVEHLVNSKDISKEASW